MQPDAGLRGECEERQLMEVEALAGLYADGGGAEGCPAEDGRGRDVHVWTVAAPLSGAFGAGETAAVSFRLPPLYPLQGHPAVLTRVAAPSSSELAAEAARNVLAAAADSGVEALYEAMETVRETVAEGLAQLGAQASGRSGMGSAGTGGRCASRTDACRPSPAPHVLPISADGGFVLAPPDGLRHGEPFVEKKSTFQAHAAPIASAEGARDVVDFLLQDNKVRRASHNMMAYRVDSGAGGLAEDCDDDGESAAGGRLLHLLQAMDARGVVVIVSRWYGGVKLGPARFTHINNAARLLLEDMGYARSRKAKR